MTDEIAIARDLVQQLLGELDPYSPSAEEIGEKAVAWLDRTQHVVADPPQPPARVLVENGKDCFRACVASIMAKRLDEIPPFEDLGDDEWFDAAVRWVRSQGWELTPYLVGSVFYIQCLSDPEGGKHGHAVVGIDGHRAFDPGRNWPEFDAKHWPDTGRLYLFPRKP